ncbi:MAG: pectinesterase family protein [Paludibacter sp.]|nr:pectinesterase family protein [Paludibacter sp.]
MKNNKIIKILFAVQFFITLSTNIQAIKNVSKIETISESSVVTWPFNVGGEGQLATYSTETEGYYSLNWVDKGSNLAFKDISTNYSVTYTRFQPTVQNNSVTENDFVGFHIRPKTGLSFTPKQVSFDCMRYGTSGGLINVIWKSADGTLTTIATALSPARNDSGDGTHALYDLSTVNIPASNGDCTLYLYIYSLGNTKQVGLSNITLTGTLTGTIIDVASYSISSSVFPTEAGSIVTAPIGTQFDDGTDITLTANRNFGYQFKEWRDANTDAVVSTANPYTFTLTANTSLKAVFDPITTYNFTVDINGSQWGNVSLNPMPNNGKYETGTIVSMTAVPNAVCNFLNWDDQTTDISKTILVDADKNFTATFDEIPFIVGWDFKAQTPNSERQADYFSETTNTGLFSLKNSDGSTASWLARPGSFSPSYSCIQMWTPAANFATPRYYQASFSTVGYKNIQLKSMLSGSYHMYPVIQLFYSTDGENFTKLKDVDISLIYGSGWAELNETLPVEAENVSKIYIRWIADTNSSPLLGNEVDVDGTAITNIYVYADKEIVNDLTAPTLITTVPAENATNASANGSIVLTFDEKLKVGTGDCTLGSTALTPSFGSKTVTFAYSKLSYNTDYTFSIPAGALTDLSGNVYSGTTIHFRTMNRPQPIAKVFDAVIAKDGSGDFTSVQAAIDAAPVNSSSPYLILIKNGVYSGHVDIPLNKPFIHMIGQFRDSVVIEDNRLCGSNGDPNIIVYSIDPGASVVIKSANCYFENITFSNSYGYTAQAGPQALAVFTNNDKIVFKNCWMRSYQDTYMTGSGMANRGYMTNCKIEGAVDFIYGQGDFFFDKCTIYCTRPTGGYIVAPNHPLGTKWGYVFSNCTIDGKAGVVTYFGRPWHEAPKTSFFNTICKIGIYPVGWWYTMGGIPAIFADYNTMDADGNPMDLSQRISNYQYDVKDANGNVTSTVTGTAKNSFTDEEAAQYTYENVTSGTDSWDPRIKTEATEAPILNVNEKTILWNTVDYAICYLVSINGEIVAQTTDNSYDATTSGTAKVIAVSESGALSAASNPVQLVGTSVKNILNNSELKISQKNNKLEIANLPENSSIKIYNFNGVPIQNKKNISGSYNIIVNQNLLVLVKTSQGVDVFKVLKK